MTKPGKERGMTRSQKIRNVPQYNKRYYLKIKKILLFPVFLFLWFVISFVNLQVMPASCGIGEYLQYL